MNIRRESELEQQVAARDEEIVKLRRLLGVYMNDARRRLDPELSDIVSQLRSERHNVVAGTSEARQRFTPPEGAIVLHNGSAFQQPEIIADLEDRLFQALAVIGEFRVKCDPAARVVPVSEVERLRDGWQSDV